MSVGVYINELKISCLILFCVFISLTTQSQVYTSFFTGNTRDTVTISLGGICMMGGATENDQAMRWFLKQANGGDVLVLRTSGSDGYNQYLFSELGISVNSVETIVCNSSESGRDPYVLKRIKQAEAIWFAGGDQWTYVSFWRHSAVDSLVNEAIQKRNIVVGGTSAGMAILGSYYFSARMGTVTSTVALSNPYGNLVTIDSASFIKNNNLKGVITDTHFNNPDRKGRLMTFLARIYTDYSQYAKAIACDEYMAVTIAPDGLAKVYSNYPAMNNYVYFIQSNCELTERSPERCIVDYPLIWNCNGKALRVFRVKGNSTGTITLQPGYWNFETSGTWYNWGVNSGVLIEEKANPLVCQPLQVPSPTEVEKILMFPNPVHQFLTVKFNESILNKSKLSIVNILGKRMNIHVQQYLSDAIIIDLSGYENGMYFLILQMNDGSNFRRSFIKN